MEIDWELLQEHEVTIRARENSGWWISCAHADVAGATFQETMDEWKRTINNG